MANSCALCGDWPDYAVTTGTETLDVCAAELMAVIDTGLTGMREPFLVVRRPSGWVPEPEE